MPAAAATVIVQQRLHSDTTTFHAEDEQSMQQCVCADHAGVQAELILGVIERQQRAAGPSNNGCSTQLMRSA